MPASIRGSKKIMDTLGRLPHSMRREIWAEIDTQTDKIGRAVQSAVNTIARDEHPEGFLPSRRAVNWKSTKGGGFVGLNTKGNPSAPQLFWREFGTVKQPPRPLFRPLIKAMRTPARRAINAVAEGVIKRLGK